jgi:glutamine amidotransferase
MGWNRVTPARSQLIAAGDAYFVHSFALESADPAQVAALVEYGGPRVAAVVDGSAMGVQFHPEKSQAYGLALLRRFLAWRP